MAEAEREEAVGLRNKASEVLKSTSIMALPASKEPKPSYFLTKSSAEMVSEDPIRLRNQSCIIREEIVQTLDGEQLVYSSLAGLPTFSIGLSSTEGEAPPLAPLRESSVDLRDKSPPRYFQMPELGARVFVGDNDGFNTMTCHLFDKHYEASEFDIYSEYAALRSVYKDDHPGGLSSWLRAQPAQFWGSEDYSKVILSGNEFFGPFTCIGEITVGNLGGKNSRVCGSISDYKDCASDITIRQPSDVDEQLGDLVPSVRCVLPGYWRTEEKPGLFRLPKGSYLRKPEFMKWDDLDCLYDHPKKHVLQLTRFDDFVILCSHLFSDPRKVLDIVQKNASETADAIAAQLVKGAMEDNQTSHMYPITAIVILDHKEILLNDHKKEKKENMAPEDIAKFEEEKVFTSKMENSLKGRSRMEEVDIVELLVCEPFPNDLLGRSMFSLEENEFMMDRIAINSKLLNKKTQVYSNASSSIVLIEDDDCKSEDLMVLHDITKWIIYGDLQERTLICFFNVEEKQYEFYFEDHESMATIIGLAVPHAKVILECGSPHVTIVEILEEYWNIVWSHSNDIPLSIQEGYVLKQEQFPNILHYIANIINSNNIVSKANNGGGRGDNGKGKAHDHDDRGNSDHLDGGFNETPNANDKKEWKGKDGNDDKKDTHDQNDGKTSNDGKDVKVDVYLNFLPGRVLEEKGKINKPGEFHEEKGEKKKPREVHEEEEGVNMELGEVYEDEEEGESMELEEVHGEVGEDVKMEPREIREEEEEEGKNKGEDFQIVEKKKKKSTKAWWHVFKQGKNGKVVENQLGWTTTEGGENGDLDENLQEQLKEQIHAEMIFTLRIQNEAGGTFKTIQATINYIEFQFPSKNKKNYLQRRRFGWFHKKLKVAFGVVDRKASTLDPKSRKVLDSLEVEEVSSRGNSKGNASTSTNAFKVRGGGTLVGVTGFAEYTRTNGSEAKTTKEVHNSRKTNIRVTKGDFSFSDRTILKNNQLKYSYCPLFPFNEKEFEVKDEDDRLHMYHLNPICQSQQVSCEGTWHPKNLRNLEAYKLEASRELGMTKVYNSELETVQEKKRKGVWKVDKNLPLCFIQKLEKVVYLNHAMSHLTSSTSGVYRLRELDVQSNPSTSCTQLHDNKESKWPGNDPLVYVKLERDI